MVTLNEANKKVEELIFFCVEKNYKEILLITGKGFIQILTKMYTHQKI